jgi:hypothetical protein
MEPYSLVSKRYTREYKEDGFAICANIGKKGAVFIENMFHQRYAFYYTLYGSHKVGRLFDSNFVHITETKTLVDLQNYWDDDGFVTQSTSDFHVIGFNVFTTDFSWEAKLLTAEDKTIIMEKQKNILVCLNGKAIISGNPLKRYDYMKLEPNQEYVVDKWDNAEIAIFSVVGPR